MVLLKRKIELRHKIKSFIFK